MCDCFHLAFPNWHASAAGEGRRLKGPEQDTDDDLVCEEPEVLEGERPRPQGSSPVEEFPTTEKYVKQAEGDFYDSPTKSSKKGKRIGFGSLFDKRPPAKMNQTEDMQSDQSEMIVKTVKEVCAEGLVVSGGGMDGIFIKEVKPESPASKHLNVKEGDQILSATVYFDNVSYEDALQILEHAQPYKVAFCVKRKPPPRAQEDAETMRPDITIGEEAEQKEGGPEMRGRRKTKKQHDRISWPKFPTFSKGRRANFKRSHSTSEAEEQRKLEISPTTSDTESPLKSPLKSPDEKDKKKTHKMKLKMRMAGRRTKSVEETENEEATDNMEVMDNQIIMNITEEQVPVINVIESPKILNEDERTDSTKTRNEYTFPTLPVTESVHKVELISLDTTLKTTDITVALGDDGKEKEERSEVKVSIPGKDKYDVETESQLKSPTSGMRTSDASTFDNIMDSPNILSQIEVGRQVDSDSKPTDKEILAMTPEPGETDMNIPKVDVSLDMPDVGPISKSPKIGSDKEKKERNILEAESYGIRTRGPLAEIATSKTHFGHTVNRIDFTSPDTFTFDIQRQDVSLVVTDKKKPITTTPVISQPKSHAMDVDTEVTKTESNFKLPKVDLSKFDQGELITVRQKDPAKVPLLKREEIEIPGMEDKGSKAKSKSPRMKQQKIEKIINITKAEKSQHHGEAEEFNVEDVKEAVSKFPAFKLPDRDITGVLVQREVTILEMKSDKTGLTPKGSPCKISSMSTEINIDMLDTMDKKERRMSPVFSKDQVILLPKSEQLHQQETGITESKTEQSKIKLVDHKTKTDKHLLRDKSPDVQFKLPKREDIEIPGMEAIEQAVQLQKIKVTKETDTQDEAVKDYTGTDIKADRKGHEKKSKKGKVSLPSFGIMAPDIRFPGIAIELPIKATSSKSDSDAVKEMKPEAKVSLGEYHVAIKQFSEEATMEKSQRGEGSAPEHERKKAKDIECDQMLHHDVSTAVVKEQDDEGELKPEIKSKEKQDSPHKKKLPKLKMPKIGGKSVKGTTEIPTKEDVKENDFEVVFDSDRRTSEIDPKEHSLETDKNWSKLKMPSIDVSVPKIKIPKTEGKSKQEETGPPKPEMYADIKDHISGETTQKPTKERVGKVDLRVEAVEDTRDESGFKLIKFGISLPKEKTEEAGQLPEESEKSIIQVDGKTEVELSEVPQGEIKETDSKMKKRKISFPKFGFSKSDSKVSDADITVQDADGAEADVEIKTTATEVEFKDSTDSSTKFRLPTIKLPKFGVSFSKTADVGDDIQMPDVRTEESTMDVKMPETTFSAESTALSDQKRSKPEADLLQSEGKAEIKGYSIPKEFKKEMKSSEIISFSKPEVNASLTDNNLGELPAEAFSKSDIKSPGVDVSIPQVDASIPEGSVEITEPDVNFTISHQKKHEAEDINLTGGTVKLTSVSLPVFGGKPSKIVKDMPNVDIDIKEPDVSLPEAEISMKLKDEALSSDVKDSFIAKDGQRVSVDMKFEEAKLKKQEVTVTLPKIGISLPKVEVQKTENSVDKESKSGQAEKAEASVEDLQVKKLDMEVKLPLGSVDVVIPEAKEKESEIKLKKRKISFPKFGFSKPDTKIPDAQKEEISVPDTEIKETEVKIPAPELEAQLKTKSTSGSPSKFKLPTISLPKFDISISKTGQESTAKATADAHSEIKAAVVAESQDKDTGAQDTEPSKPTFETLPEYSDTKMKDTDPESQGSRFIMPKFEFSFPKLKGPEFKKGALRTDLEKTEATQKIDIESAEGKADIPEASLEMEVTMKKTKVPSSEHEFPDINVKTGDPSMAVGELDVYLEPDLKNQTTETLKDDSTMGGSPIKFKLPSFKLPKFGTSSSKVKAEITDVKGEEITLKAEDVLTLVEASDVKIDFNVPSQELKKPSISVHQPEVDIEISKSDISLPEGKLGEQLAEVPHAKLESKIDQEIDPGVVKIKRPGFSLPKFGFSKPDFKVPETDDSLAQADICKPEGDVTIKEQSMKIATSTVEAEQKDPTTLGATTKFTLPSINLPRIGGQSIKEEKTMPYLDIAVKGHEVSSPDTQIQISGETSTVDIKGPRLATEGQSVSVDLMVEDVELGGQAEKLKMPKFGIGLPKVKGFDLSTSKTEKIAEVHKIDIKPPVISTEGKVHLPEQDSKGIDAPELEFSKPDVKLPEVDISIQKTDLPIPQGSIDLEEGNVDIKMTKVESDQKGSTIFGSPTKFKLPSLSLPKFGVKSQKVKSDITVADSELEGTNIKTDIAKPDIKLEEQSSDMPDVDSRVLQAKVKRPSFSFPKFGFSKPETATPEVDISEQKVEVSIPEGNVPAKEQTVEIPGMDGEQKDLTIVSSPTKFKLPEFNLPKFGVKSSKGTVRLPSADEDIDIEITTHKQDIKVSGQIPKMEKDTNLQATIREADVHLTEGKVLLPQPDVDVQNISTEGKADIPQVDSKGFDVKVKKPSFSLPKFGFSKPDIDASQTKVDISVEEGNIHFKDQDAEITFTDEVNKQKDLTTQTKFKMPSINFPKFGLKYSKAPADISTAEVEFKEPEISVHETREVQITDRQTSIDIKGTSIDVDHEVKAMDIEGTGKFKLPKFGIGMAKVKEIHTEGKEINIEAGLLCEENVDIQQPDDVNLTIQGKLDKAEVDSKGLKIKLPKLGFSKSDLKTPEIDVTLPKAGMDNVDVAEQCPDIKLQVDEPDVKEVTFGSPTRFTLPNISFPKFGIKTSKDAVEIPTAQVDIKGSEISLPDEKLNISGEVSSIDVKGPTVNVKDVSTELNIKGDDKEQQEGKLKLPKFGIALPTIKGPGSEQVLKKTVMETEVKISGDVPKGSIEVDIEAEGAELEVEESKLKLPQPGISLQAEVSQTKVKGDMSFSAEKDSEIDKPTDLTDMSSKGPGLKIKKPSFGFPKIAFSKSDGKTQDIEVSETAGDISLPEATTEMGESEREGKHEITSPQFGSPTKLKLPSIKLPKFGVSAPKLTTEKPKTDSDIKKINVSSVDYEIETQKLDVSDGVKSQTAETETPSINISIKEKELNQEGQEIKFKIPKFGISLPKVKGPEVIVTEKDAKIGTSETGITEPEIKIAADDVSLPKVDMALEGSSSLEKKETELKDDKVVSGSPSKFKLPAFKMPKFGKTSDAKGKVSEVEIPDTTTDLNIEDKTIQVSTDKHRDGELKKPTEQLPEPAVKKLDSDKGSPSKFKLPTIKMPKISISRTKSQEENDTTVNANAPESKTDPEDSQTPGKSPRFTMPALEDVLRGFEVEFNVPAIEEKEVPMDKPSVKQAQVDGAKVEEAAEHKDKGSQEKSKFKFKFPKLGFSQSSDESDKLVDAKIEESEKHLEASADVKEATTSVTKEQTKTEKGGWFKFSFSSPTKTAKTSEKEEIVQQPEETEKCDDVEKESSKPHEEPEKSPLSEAVEENLSPTLSLRSSEAFADISSTVTTEQAGISQISPTKVTVKYAEPAAAVEVNDMQSDVVTSTARCELISMEPHQPEKVNIPFSSDMSSTSIDTLKQMSGEIHIITSNIQAIPDTHKAAILTNLDAHGIHTSPLQVTLGSESVLTVEETRVQSGKHTIMERHVVQETLHDDNETILVTQRMRVFEGDSAEPISDETASSIRKLRDTVHTEKMRFFDSGATVEEVTIMSSDTTLRHMDSSTDENGGK